jgi:predicted O-linked N-acetylglucosamine transferase (SPINDLY family)
MSFQNPQEALNLAMTHHQAGRHAQAEELYRQLLQTFPTNTDLIHLLGVVAVDGGRWAEGRVHLERAIQLNANVPHYHTNFGTKLVDNQEYALGITHFQQALKLKPECGVTFYNMGRAFMATRQWEDAISAYQNARRARPDFPPCELDLGTVLEGAGRRSEAIAHYRERLRRFPDDIAVANNLGNLLKDSGELDEAIKVYEHAALLDPDHLVVQNNLGLAYKNHGQIEKSIALLIETTEKHPGLASLRSNLILTLLYDLTDDISALLRQQRLWNQHHSEPLHSQRRPHLNTSDEKRRLKIGYVSADLRDHVAGRALLPVLTHHDRTRFEVVCYCLNPHDAMTSSYKSQADLWRDVGQLTDGKLAAAIQDDQIDLLIDLGLHTSENRLVTFALKPAPIQISWIGYPGSSGVDAIDYRLTDAFLEPPGGEPCVSQEKPFALPNLWQCYVAPEGAAEVSDLPAQRNGYVTFGSFNNFCKITPHILESWAQILSAVPGSHLVLLNNPGSHRAHTREFMHQKGIAPERIEFIDYEPTTPTSHQGNFLKRYHQIDIALDTFPYNGMTTTFDALWMGVPVVSLIGQTSVGRAGLSILSNLGLPEFATDSVGAYVRQAIETAQDLPHLAKLRQELRPRMAASPLCDALSLTHDLEAAYLTMWKDWCTAQVTKL